MTIDLNELVDKELDHAIEQILETLSHDYGVVIDDKKINNSWNVLVSKKTISREIINQI